MGVRDRTRFGPPMFEMPRRRSGSLRLREEGVITNITQQVNQKLGLVRIMDPGWFVGYVQFAWHPLHSNMQIPSKAIRSSSLRTFKSNPLDTQKNGSCLQHSNGFVKVPLPPKYWGPELIAGDLFEFRAKLPPRFSKFSAAASSMRPQDCPSYLKPAAVSALSRAVTSRALEP